MTIANFDEIDEFAREAYRLAEESAGVIKFSVTEGLTKNSRSITASAPYHIGNTPQFVSLETTHGVAGWAVLLAVDLRKSSDRAVRIGAKKTFLTMHTYIPTMAELVVRNGGKVGSLRGDGLFAVFGFKENTYPSRPVTEAEGAAAINNATCCGRAMIEATKEILNPILSEKEIEAGLVVGGRNVYRRSRRDADRRRRRGRAYALRHAGQSRLQGVGRAQRDHPRPIRQGYLSDGRRRHRRVPESTSRGRLERIPSRFASQFPWHGATAGAAAKTPAIGLAFP